MGMERRHVIRAEYPAGSIALYILPSEQVESELASLNSGGYLYAVTATELTPEQVAETDELYQRIRSNDELCCNPAVTAAVKRVACADMSAAIEALDEILARYGFSTKPAPLTDAEVNARLGYP